MPTKKLLVSQNISRVLKKQTTQLKKISGKLVKKGDRVILVVEDETPLQNVIRKKLELAGFKVVTARKVSQALEYIKLIDKISAVWLDHYLLGKDDGLVLVAKLKSDKSKYRKIPIFVVSNTASHNKVRAYLNLGVSRFYVKSDCRLDSIVKDLKIFC